MRGEVIEEVILFWWPWASLGWSPVKAFLLKVDMMVNSACLNHLLTAAALAVHSWCQGYMYQSGSIDLIFGSCKMSLYGGVH